MRADRAIGPALAFPIRDGLRFIGEYFVLGYRFHTESLLNQYGYVKWIIPENLERVGVSVDK